MISTLLITLREGLEASLIIGIIYSYLVKNSNKRAVIYLWLGVGLAVAISLLIGVVLSIFSKVLSLKAEELFVAVTSLIVVVLVTWMVFWMKSHANGIAVDLKNKTDNAIKIGNMAIFLVVFFAVIREGVETAIFLFAKLKTFNQSFLPVIGIGSGLTLAILLGWLVYKRSLKINLKAFFRLTGIALIFIAGGVLMHGVSELQSYFLLPGVEMLVWEISKGNNLLKYFVEAILGFSNSVSVLAFIIYFIYILVTLTIFLKVKPPKLQLVD